MPTKLRNMTRGGGAKKKAPVESVKSVEKVDNEADACKENNVLVEEGKSCVMNSVVSLTVEVIKTAESSEPVKQESADAAASGELSEISANKNKKTTKSRSKLTTSVTVTASEQADSSKPVIDAVSMSTTTIETVETKEVVVKGKTASKGAKAARTATKTSTRNLAAGSVGSCSESSNSGASTASATSSSNEAAAAAAATAVKAKKKKLKSLDTSSFSDSFTKFFVNKKITDYFQVRKSTRKCKSDIEKEKRKQIEDAILNMKEEGLEVRNVDQKGRGIFATRAFKKGEFVCEYAGEMVSYAEAKEREERYAKDESVGCYMYFFEHKSKSYCIDATAESNRLGRLLNHSKLDGNCQTKLFEIDSRPYLILVAARDIKSGEELLYDYGDRNKMAIEYHPWLAQ